MNAWRLSRGSAATVCATVVAGLRAGTERYPCGRVGNSRCETVDSNLHRAVPDSDHLVTASEIEQPPPYCRRLFLIPTAMSPKCRFTIVKGGEQTEGAEKPSAINSLHRDFTSLRHCILVVTTMRCSV